MNDGTILGFASREWDAPFQGGGADQHFAGGGSRLPHRIPSSTHTATASGALIAEELAGARLFDRDLLPVSLEFLGEDHRERGVHALSHLRTRNYDGDLSVGCDLQISVGSKCVPCGTG